jgi:hypothetical protein
MGKLCKQTVSLEEHTLCFCVSLGLLPESMWDAEDLIRDPSQIYIVHANVSDSYRRADVLFEQGKAVQAEIGMSVRENPVCPWSENRGRGVIESLSHDKGTEVVARFDNYRRSYKCGKRSIFDLVLN